MFKSLSAFLIYNTALVLLLAIRVAQFQLDNLFQGADKYHVYRRFGKDTIRFFLQPFLIPTTSYWFGFLITKQKYNIYVISATFLSFIFEITPFRLV